MYYQIEYRQAGQQMLYSKDTTDRNKAEKMFQNAQFKGKCDCIELWAKDEDVPGGKLLDTKSK